MCFLDIISLFLTITAYRQHLSDSHRVLSSAPLPQLKRFVNEIIPVRFEVFTAVTMKNAVFWDVAPCISCVNRRFGGTYRLHYEQSTIILG
jgi:hypothetical protein